LLDLAAWLGRSSVHQKNEQKEKKNEERGIKETDKQGQQVTALLFCWKQ
jgi:hypothetical protein